MFTAINIRVFTKQTSLLLLMFADSCKEGKHFSASHLNFIEDTFIGYQNSIFITELVQPCFTKVLITSLIMVRFEKFNLVLKLESKGYKFSHATNVCEFVKIAKFANIYRTWTFVDLQYCATTLKVFECWARLTANILWLQKNSQRPCTIFNQESTNDRQTNRR